MRLSHRSSLHGERHPVFTMPDLDILNKKWNWDFGRWEEIEDFGL